MDDEISIFILNHGKFGEELIKSAELIVGKISNIQAFSLLSGISIEDFYEKVNKSIQLTKGKKLILCDLFGGTPCNVAMMIALQTKISIVCGVNLPMLIDVILKRGADKTLDEIVQSAVETGQKAVSIPSGI